MSLNQTNVSNVTLHLLIQAIWGHIWKCTVEKSQTDATNVTMPLLRQVIWGDIWKHTVEKSQTNVIQLLIILRNKNSFVFLQLRMGDKRHCHNKYILQRISPTLLCLSQTQYHHLCHNHLKLILIISKRKSKIFVPPVQTRVFMGFCRFRTLSIFKGFRCFSCF